MHCGYVEKLRKDCKNHGYNCGKLAQLNYMNPQFDKILKELMKEQKLNQLQLAEILGIRQSQISNWLNGKSLPGYYSLILLCEKLKVSANDLLKV